MIDAMNCRGQLRVQTEGGWGRPRTQKLLVGGRDRTKLIGGMHFQLQKVRECLAAAGGHAVPITGMLCFIDVDWPPLCSPFTIGNVKVLWPKKIKNLMFRAHSLDEAAIEHWHRVLAKAFRVA